MIMNTDRDSKKGRHWWTLLELHTRRNINIYIYIYNIYGYRYIIIIIIIIDSFGFTGFKEFITDNDCKIIGKLV